MPQEFDQAEQNRSGQLVAGASIVKTISGPTIGGSQSRVELMRTTLHSYLELARLLSITTIDKGVKDYIKKWLDRQLEIELMHIAQG